MALLLFGSGPVRGFAVVHCIGILTSMFSAVFFSRGLVNLWYGRKKKLKTRVHRHRLAPRRRSARFARRLTAAARTVKDTAMEFFRIRKDIPFMRHALVLNAISAITFSGRRVFPVQPGLNLSVEFTGGTVMEVAYEQPADLAAVRQRGRSRWATPRCRCRTSVPRAMCCCACRFAKASSFGPAERGA